MLILLEAINFRIVLLPGEKKKKILFQQLTLLCILIDYCSIWIRLLDDEKMVAMRKRREKWFGLVCFIHVSGLMGKTHKYQWMVIDTIFGWLVSINCHQWCDLTNYMIWSIENGWQWICIPNTKYRMLNSQMQKRWYWCGWKSAFHKRSQFHGFQLDFTVFE